MKCSFQAVWFEFPVLFRDQVPKKLALNSFLIKWVQEKKKGYSSKLQEIGNENAIAKNRCVLTWDRLVPK